MARHALFPLTSLHALETQPPHKGPNVNLQRDPRWGRTQEVPGEDPYLTGEYGSIIIAVLYVTSNAPLAFCASTDFWQVPVFYPWHYVFEPGSRP